jgi:hypothetical protein
MPDWLISGGGGGGGGGSGGGGGGGGGGDAKASASSFSLSQLQQQLLGRGAAYFDADGRSPATYLKVLLQSLQFEHAVAFAVRSELFTTVCAARGHLLVPAAKHHLLLSAATEHLRVSCSLCCFALLCCLHNI